MSRDQLELLALEKSAQEAKKGIWSDPNGSLRQRHVQFTIENPKVFLEQNKGKLIPGVLF